LRTRISALVESTGLRGRCGIYIKVVKTNRVIYNERGDVPMIPASNQKVLTTAAALDMLGPDFRYQTELLGPPADSSGVISGHLYLRGSGDPSFCEPYNSPATEPFRFFIRQLRKDGIKAVVGDVVADDSAFDREFRGQGWFERYLLDDYAAGVSALSVNANLVEVIVSSDKVQLNPSTSTVKIVNKLKQGGYSEVYVQRAPGSDVVTVGGVIAPGHVVRRLITVDNPSLFSAGVFSRLLEKGGIHHRGGVRLIDPAGEAARLNELKVYARFYSPRLVELVAQINKESDNVFAQHLFKTLGERHRGRGTASNAEAAVLDFMARSGIDSNGVKMVDGSGLSVLNRVSPRQMVGVLQAMWRHPHAQTFIDTLPAGGEGTLRYRLSGLTVRAKTGTLAGHSALSGYVVSAYGQTVAFSVIVNDVEGTWSAVDLQDRVVQTLAAWQAPF
ncbi:MAG: D-alanyl-D-alanine carboxypeptidase/D-alanyl-D-alanine-endopeptidase, partial [Candidatus Eremiobacterota bacterium]